MVVDDEDIAKVRTESTKIINLVQFTDDDAIDPMYVDKAYYLAPEGPMAADAYSVMRDGMQGKAGIGKVAIHGREYLVAVKPHKQGLVMYTLHHAAEIRTIDQIDELREVRGKVNPAEMKLARQVIESIEGDLDLADYKDEYQEGLRAIIDAKVAGEEIVAPTRRGAAQGRGPDGSAAQEPRSGQLGQEEDGEGGASGREEGHEHQGGEERRGEETQGVVTRRPSGASLWR